MGESPEPEPPKDPRQDTNLAVLVFIVIFVIACTWLLIEFRKESQIQDCVFAGHRNCVPLDVPQR